MKNKFFVCYFVDAVDACIRSEIIKTDMNLEETVSEYLNNKKAVINIIKLN